MKVHNNDFERDPGKRYALPSVPQGKRWTKIGEESRIEESVQVSAKYKQGGDK
jgi:hypothetical protein